VDILYWLAQTIYDFMNEGPGGWSFLLWGFLAAAPVVVLHELGHAIVAVHRLGTEVEVTVGNAMELARVRMGRIHASLNALPHPGYAGGSASFDASHATARDILWIALAGPLTSLVGLVATAYLLSHAPASSVIHDVLWWMTLSGAFAVVLNLLPFKAEESDGMKVWTDGRLALDALRVMRAT
jgi:hypothetical protein